MRVPVVIYNNLSLKDEVRLFTDINTTQKPVPNELLLDIKSLAETETDSEALLRSLFDMFSTEKNSPLFGLMSPAEKRGGLKSRVTFNAAVRSILHNLSGSDTDYIYNVLSSYLRAWTVKLEELDSYKNIANPMLFRAILLLFPTVASRVADRYDEEYNVDNFTEIMSPMFDKIRSREVQNPAGSHLEILSRLKSKMEASFAIGRKRT